MSIQLYERSSVHLSQCHDDASATRHQWLFAILWQRSLNSSHGTIDSAPPSHRTTTADASPAAVALMKTSCGTSRCGAPFGLGAPGRSARFARGKRYSRPCQTHAGASRASGRAHLVGHNHSFGFGAKGVRGVQLSSARGAGEGVGHRSAPHRRQQALAAPRHAAGRSADDCPPRRPSSPPAKAAAAPQRGT